MATNKQGRRTEDFQTDLHVKNILPQLVHVNGNLEEAMFLALLNELPMVSTPIKKFSYYLDDWLPSTDTTDAAVTSTATTIGVTTPLAFLTGHLWRNKRTSEVIYVTSVGQTSIEAERQVGYDSTNSTGTAAAAMNSGDTLIRIGATMGEVSRRQIHQSTVPVEVFNYAEKKRYEITMSDVERKTRMITGNDWDYQVDKAFQQARKDMNGWLYIGERNKTTINGQQHWLAGGIDQFITTTALSVSGTLHEYAFDQWLIDNGMRYGPTIKTLLASSAVLRAISEIAKDKIEYRVAPLTGGEGQNLGMGVNVISYNAGGKRINMVEDRFLTETMSGHARVVDLSVCRIRTFDGDGLSGAPQMKYSTQEIDADDFSDAIVMDLGMEWGPGKHHGKISGVTAGSAGRAVS